MSIQGAKHTIWQWVKSWRSSKETKLERQEPIDTAIDYLLDYDANPYEFAPQEPEQGMDMFIKRPVRFLHKDGGIRSGIIVMCIPVGYRPDGWCYYRVLDLRRMEIYTIRGDALQMMRTRE